MAETSSPEVVEVRRTFSALPEQVFDAWTDPAKMTKWFARGTAQNTITKMEADVRPGGKYRVIVTEQNGKTHHIAGMYREIRRPDKIVFTWTLETQADFGESLVTIEFRRLGQSQFTEVVLQHARLAEKYRPDHNKGWIACFELLEKVLAGQL